MFLYARSDTSPWLAKCISGLGIGLFGFHFFYLLLRYVSTKLETWSSVFTTDLGQFITLRDFDENVVLARLQELDSAGSRSQDLKSERLLIHTSITNFLPPSFSFSLASNLDRTTYLSRIWSTSFISGAAMVREICESQLLVGSL